jgi:hypothetical protein
MIVAHYAIFVLPPIGAQCLIHVNGSQTTQQKQKNRSPQEKTIVVFLQ